jgi:hypothetical protein
MARGSAVHAPIDSRRAAIRRTKWRRWIARLEDEFHSLLMARATFDTVHGIVRSNPRIQTPYHFHVWLVHNYVFAVSVRIRRLMDLGTRKGQESVSLLRLLKEIENSSSAMTRRSFLWRCHGEIRAAMGEEFDRIAGSGRASLPSAVPRRDRERLERAHRRIRRWVDKRFAHLDQRNLSLKPPTMDEMNRVVDLLAQTFLKYRLLLRSSSCILDPGRVHDPVRWYDRKSLLPPWQEDWTSVFEQAWIPPGGDD